MGALRGSNVTLTQAAFGPLVPLRKPACKKQTNRKQKYGRRFGYNCDLGAASVSEGGGRVETRKPCGLRQC
jgi:hypothetical protein